MNENDDFYIKPKKVKRGPGRSDKVNLKKAKPGEAGAAEKSPAGNDTRNVKTVDKRLGLKKSGEKKQGSGKGKMPTKNSINLIIKERSDIRPEIAVPAILVILILAALFSKFAVVDLLTDLSRAEGEVNSVQAQIDADYAEISGYDDLEDRYAHYTYSGMDDTELTTVSRGDILDLLREQVMPYAQIGSWSVYYNTVSLEITDSSLQEIGLIVQQLKNDDRVEYCTVNTAQSDADTVTYTTDGELTVDTDAGEDTVTAQVTIYMMDVVKGAFEG